MGVPTRDLQNFCVSKGKDATIQDFKLEILICFNLSIIEH
jgi:hypothetical protein